MKYIENFKKQILSVIIDHVIPLTARFEHLVKFEMVLDKHAGMLGNSMKTIHVLVVTRRKV